MTKPIKIARLVIRGDTGVEPPAERDGLFLPPLSVFLRFPRSPGREAKSTPYEMTYDVDTQLVTIRHPTSGIVVQAPGSTCFWYPFSKADEKREAEELEKATAPAQRATA